MVCKSAFLNRSYDVESCLLDSVGKKASDLPASGGRAHKISVWNFKTYPMDFRVEASLPDQPSGNFNVTPGPSSNWTASLNNVIGATPATAKCTLNQVHGVTLGKTRLQCKGFEYSKSGLNNWRSVGTGLPITIDVDIV